MFSLRSKLVSLLQPWLQLEPELELKLGLLHSHVILKNLQFDVSALNRLIHHSTSLSFSEVRVQNVNVRVSPWSFPAFTLEVTGIYVKLIPRKREVDDARQSKTDWFAKEKEKKKAILSVLDPEGTVLHDAIEKISLSTSSRSWVMISLLDGILRHCRIMIHDVHLELQISVTDNDGASLLKMKELSLEALHLEHSCLLKSLIGAIFIPQSVCSLSLNVHMLEIELKRKEYVNRLLSLDDLITHIKLKDLELAQLNVRAQQISFAFTPTNLLILHEFDMLTLKQVKRARNGRELWNIAACRIGPLTSNSRLSMSKLVGVVRLWLCYVHSYESLLTLLGYPSETIFGDSSTRMSLNKKFSVHVKNKWKEVSEIEKDLSIEVLARARRIARQRAATCDRHIEVSTQPNLKANTNFFLLIFTFITKIFSFIFQLGMQVFCLGRILNRNPEADGILSDVSGDSSSQYCINVGKIFITVYPLSVIPSTISGVLHSAVDTSQLNLHSFCLTLDTFFLIYMSGNIAQSLSVSCGDLKVKSSSLIVPPLGKNMREEINQSFKRKGKERVIDSKVIIWSEPAPKSLHPEKVADDSVKSTENGFCMRLESCLEELWLNWKSSYEKFEGSNAENCGNPFVACEIKSSLMGHCLERPGVCVWKCNMSMGKLHVNLGSSSLISTYLLQKQIQHNLDKVAGSGRTAVPSQSPNTKEPEESTWEAFQKPYASGIKNAMLRLISEKEIQVGITIAGPEIRMSLQDDLYSAKDQVVSHNLTLGQRDFCIAFDLDSVKLSVWPTSKSSLSASSEESKIDYAKLVRLNEPRFLNIMEESSTGNFTCHGCNSLDSCVMINGLKVYLEDLEEKHQYQLIGMKSAFIHSLSCREYAYSFTTPFVVLSTSLHGMTTKAFALLFLDEFEVFLQVVDCILSALSHASKHFEPITGVYSQELICKADTSIGNDEFTQVSEKGIALVSKWTKFVIDTSFEFGSMDVVIHNSRKNHIVKYYQKVYGDSSSNKLSGCTIPEHGIAISLQDSNAQILWEEDGHVKICIGLQNLHSVIFHYQSQKAEHCDVYELRNLLYQSPNCLYDLSLSDFSLTICVSSHIAVDNYTSGSSTLNAMDGCPLAIPGERSDMQDCDSNQRVRSMASNLVLPSSGHQLLISISLGEILMTEYSLKDILIRAHQETKLMSSLHMSREDCTISWTIQGGLIILETTALAMFIGCFSAYLQWTRNASSSLPSREYLSARRPSETVDSYTTMATENNYPSKECSLGTTSSLSHLETCNTHLESKWQLLKALRLSLSKFSLIFASADGSGGVSEFILEADFQLNIEFKNFGRKLLFDLNRLMILSQHLNERCPDHVKEIQILHFSPIEDNELSSITVSGDISPEFQPTTSEPLDAQREYKVVNDVTGNSHFISGNYILKHAAASILVEKVMPIHTVGQPWLNINWIGGGSVTGLDLAVSLSEIQMVVALIESLSGDSSGGIDGNSKERHELRNQGQDNSSEDTIPDGAIVTIQDIHQHCYFAVEGVESKYHVIGTIHHSLVGERALFRVEYSNRKRWGSAASWFTLISLHAKSGSGEMLSLNYRSGSGFVDISSNNGDCSLWRTLDYKRESYEADDDLEFDSQASKHTYYLVNKKCDCAVAFIDGIPEFVRKPGNPFKVKRFPDVSLSQHDLRADTHMVGTYGSDVQQHTHEDKDQISQEASNLPYINIVVDKVVLTIVHEFPGANEKFPLLQACIDNTQLIIQIQCSKARFILTFTAALLYFDAQGNLWREIVSPVEICMFYRSRFESQSSEVATKGAPIRLYLRITQVDVSLTELSLDILLFVVGELRMAGPFAVRSSVVFANCCKIVNQSSLNLLCHFYDNQDATVAGKQSTSIFIRPIALADKPETSPFLSVQLTALGGFTTSPIFVSLSKARVLAWRTRVRHGSKSSPGPFIVVDVSKNTEDGLSVVVSPLLRIHNITGLSMELRFLRPQQKEAESASVLLRNGDAIDDSMAALEAINLHGGSKKVLMSLILGNFLFSCKPEITECFKNLGEHISADWSEDLKGGKAVCISGIFDKLSYRFKRALGVESMKISFSTVHCSLKIEGSHITDLHFLIQTVGKDVPVVQPDDIKEKSETTTVPVALQEQKEIFLLPTVQVSNYLQTKIHVLLTEKNPDISTTEACNFGKQATILCGSSAYLYANPAMIYFTITLTEYNTSCKAVNSGDWEKKLRKKSNVNYLDIDLEFGGRKYFATLRLSLSDRGVLEAAIFTSYILQNDSDLSLLCLASDKKPLSRVDIDNFESGLPPDLGTFLPPKSIRSWFAKSNKINLRLMEEKASGALLDLDVVSGITEVCLETLIGAGIRDTTKLGISLKPWNAKISLPSRLVSILPRYVISNETDETIFIRQCYLEEDINCPIAVDGKEKASLHVKTGSSSRKEINFFDSLFRKHRHANEDHLIYIQFRLNDIRWSWSGPICITSLGRFFLKFRRQMDSPGLQSSPVTGPENILTEVAVIRVVDEGSSLVMHFDRPKNFSPPYRVENLLSDSFITYYQKNSTDPEILRPGSSVRYVWDDLSLPHQLIVQIAGLNLSREINLDKVRSWKPFFKVRQQRGLALELPLDKKSRDQTKTKDESHGLERLKVGYEVYADGSTRVLQISKYPGRSKEVVMFQLCAKIQFRVSNLAIHLLENKKQEETLSEPSVYSPVIVARLGNINFDLMSTDQNKYNQLRIKSINLDEKWIGAPFAAMLRRNESDYADINEDILKIVFILLSADSGVKKVKFASTVLQPLQLNLDEETLMKFVPFWRTSLSNSNTPSQQYYFEHFEIHPVKVVASFLPGSSDSSYSSAQETLRSFLHSIIKIPAIKSKNVELNGILLTHALVTVRELGLKCAQHYSWYGMRAVYIAKGSPLLPPAFASIFDDSASSSLDIFFDPSSGLVTLPGVTLGMFKFISKCIDKKGFSGTKRYFGDLGKTVKTAGSNVLFAAVTEISDCVLRGAEAKGFHGMVNGFHQGILKLAMEPSLIGTAVMEGGPDRKIKLDRSPGADELYIEGYLQAMLDTIYRQEYLRVRVIDNLVILKNLPPSSSLMNEIMDRVRSFLISKALLQGDSSTSRPLRHLRGEREWKIGPTLLTLWEHLFVSFAIRMLRKHAIKFMTEMKVKRKLGGDSTINPAPIVEKKGIKLSLKLGVRKFVFSGVVAYLDGRLCRRIPNAIVRRIVSGFLLSLLDDDNT